MLPTAMQQNRADRRCRRCGVALRRTEGIACQVMSVHGVAVYQALAGPVDDPGAVVYLCATCYADEQRTQVQSHPVP
jgi:hypothetical protein